MQVSCFDIAVSIGKNDAQNLTNIPSGIDYELELLETKSGDPHPDTGIPPSFAVVKCETIPAKRPQYSVDMGRPTKLHCSLSRINQLEYFKEKVQNSTQLIFSKSIFCYLLIKLIITADGVRHR